MDNSKWPMYWRIAATSAALPTSHFFALGLPPPNTLVYKGYTQMYPQSKGALSRQGYKNIVILWDSMDFVQLRTLTRIVEAAIASATGIIYATIERGDGSKLLNDFIDVSGTCQPLTFTPVSNGRGVMFQNVTLTLQNIVITNDPSTAL